MGNVHLLSDTQNTQYDNFRKRFVLGLNKKGKKFETKPADLVIFTGNPNTGKKIQGEIFNKLNRIEKTTPFKQVFLMFGAGMNPLIIGEDSSKLLDQAANAVIEPILINSYQDCIAPNFIMAHKKIADDFIHRLREKVSKLKIGARGDPDANYNALTFTNDFTDLLAYKEKWKKYLVTPNAIIDPDSKAVEPHIFNFPIEMIDQVELKEHYAPFLVIFNYNSTDDIAKLNSNTEVLRKKMFVSIFGDTNSKDTKIITESFSSTQHVIYSNQSVFQAEDGNLPFGGFGEDVSAITTIQYNGMKLSTDTESRPILFSEEAAKAFGKHRKIIEWDTKQFVKGDHNFPITYGLELEVNALENPGVVLDYGPHTFTDKEWGLLNYEQKVKAAISFDKTIADKYNIISYIRLNNASAQLPKTLRSESNGNVEFNGLVFDTLSDVAQFLLMFKKRYGRAAVQGHIVFPDESKVSGITGKIIFESDRNQLLTLEDGYERYINSGILPAKNFIHHSLAPYHNEVKYTFQKMEKSLLNGESIGFPGINEKHVNGPTLRGDIYPEKLSGLEERQYHKRFDELLDGLKRTTSELVEQGNLDRFNSFSDLDLINDKLLKKSIQKLEKDPFYIKKTGAIKLGDWEKLYKRIDTAIRNLYPHIDYGTLNLGHRFLFPLRDWQHNPAVMQLNKKHRKSVQGNIKKATFNYLKEVNALATNQHLSDQELLSSLQVNLAKWAYNAKIGYLYDRFIWQQKNKLLPRISGAKSRIKKLGGYDVLSYKVNKNFYPNEDYDNFLKNSIEIITTPMGGLYPHGHVSLRIGNRLYSFDDVMTSKTMSFTPRESTNKKLGFAYYVPKSKILEMEQTIESFYKGSRNHNLPPYDIYHSLLEVSEMANGQIKFSSSAPAYGNNKTVNARWARQGRKLYLESPDGFKYPILLKNGKKFVQGLSCSTSAIHLLQKYLGLKIASSGDVSAQALRDQLLLGNPFHISPGVLIDYSP